MELRWAMFARVAPLVFVVACATEQPHAVTLAHEPTKPVETAGGTLLSPRAPPQTGNACVMLYECGCNAGCTKVDRAMDALSPGKQVGITSGPLKGTTAFVARQQTDSGESVLTVQRADPSSPIQVCGSPRSSFIGYGCSVKDGGRARACTTCE